MSSVYTIKPGNTIRDVCLNATGTLVNWDAILDANDMETWTPGLVIGQKVAIPDSVQIDANGLQQFTHYPTSNTRSSNALKVLDTVWDILLNRWILRTGLWDDGGIWMDDHFWKDNP